MQQEPSNNNLFDQKTLLAVLLVGVVWFAWQSYLNKKYPPSPKPVASSQTEQVLQPEIKADGKSPVPAKALATSDGSGVLVKPGREQIFISIDAPGYSAQLSSWGMGLVNYQLKDHAHRDGSPVVFGTETEPVASLWDANTRQALDFSIRKESDSVFVGEAQLEGALVQRKMIFDPINKSVQNEVVVQKTKAEPTRLMLVLSEKKQTSSGGSFLMPSFEHQEFIAKHQGTLERFNVTGIKESFAKEISGISLAAVSSQYFASAIYDQSDVIPVMQMAAPVGNSGVLFAGLTYDISSSVHLKWTQFSGPKSHNLLKAVHPAFVEMINFGWFQSIGEILLKVMLWFHRFLHNWGLSIIALTLLVRLLVLPFNLASYKSMKKMQKVQPLIQSIRERYKDDTAALNREMMQLFKEHKVNPVGGCLPMFLQMPVFFALYQVLGQSVELYRAPFFGWITDLSLKDPFYILPILMGLAMWFQQKITPSTMDPAQAKIMQFLPVVFCVFMLALPSGLTLYILVSTVFGIVQQQIFMRDQKAAA